jgi:hypothetical protein
MTPMGVAWGVVGDGTIGSRIGELAGRRGRTVIGGTVAEKVKIIVMKFTSHP